MLFSARGMRLCLIPSNAVRHLEDIGCSKNDHLRSPFRAPPMVSRILVQCFHWNVWVKEHRNLSKNARTHTHMHIVHAIVWQQLRAGHMIPARFSPLTKTHPGSAWHPFHSVWIVWNNLLDDICSTPSPAIAVLSIGYIHLLIACQHGKTSKPVSQTPLKLEQAKPLKHKSENYHQSFVYKLLHARHWFG